MRLQQYYKTVEDNEKNINCIADTTNETIHEYRESKEVNAMQKAKKRHNEQNHNVTVQNHSATVQQNHSVPVQQNHSSSKSSDEQRKKHKKRSRSKSRKRTPSTTSQTEDSPQPKKHKTEHSTTPSKHISVNGNEKSYEKKKPSTPYKERKENKEHSTPVKENNKHIPHHITCTNTLPITTIAQDATSPCKASKIYVEQKNLPVTKNSQSPKKTHKKSDTNSPVDLLDKIMKDMDGKNWN